MDNRHLKIYLMIFLLSLVLSCENTAKFDLNTMDTEQLYDLLSDVAPEKIKKQFPSQKTIDDLGFYYRDGSTLLIKAISREHFQKAVSLLKLGANPNYIPQGYSGNSAMDLAASFKDTTYLKLLLSYGGDPDLKNVYNSLQPYPIFVAIMTRREDNLQVLLNTGVDLNVTNSTSFTPIMQTVILGEWDMALMLLNAGSNVHFINERGVSLASILNINQSGKFGQSALKRQAFESKLRKKGLSFILPQAKKQILKR